MTSREASGPGLEVVTPPDCFASPTEPLSTPCHTQDRRTTPERRHQPRKPAAPRQGTQRKTTPPGEPSRGVVYSACQYGCLPRRLTPLGMAPQSSIAFTNAPSMGRGRLVSSSRTSSGTPVSAAVVYLQVYQPAPLALLPDGMRAPSGTWQIPSRGLYATHDLQGLLASQCFGPGTGGAPQPLLVGTSYPDPVDRHGKNGGPHGWPPDAPTTRFESTWTWLSLSKASEGHSAQDEGPGDRRQDRHRLGDCHTPST